MRSNIYVYEGIECSGKSTAIQIAVDFLMKKQKRVLVVNKQDNNFDTSIRNVIQKYESTISKLQLFLLMATRFYEKVNIIQKYSMNYEYVLVDRFDISLKVFGELLHIDRNLIDTVCKSGVERQLNYVYLKIDMVTFESRPCNEERFLYNNEVSFTEIFNKKNELFDYFLTKESNCFVIENIKTVKKMSDICISMF